jgi:S-adenosylmethionine decarboxylase
MGTQSPFHFFEGPEKKVELAVEPGFPSLRDLGEEKWRHVVSCAGARVISTLENDKCFAWLLSESSLFVYDDRIVMITCGRTTLAPAVLAMLDFVPLERVRLLIYERKNSYFPEYQRSNFYDDVCMLRERVPGRAFRLGDADEHHIYLFHLDRENRAAPGDMTLEILMHGIDRAASEIFCSGPERRLETIHSSTAVCRILPGFAVDDHIFDPVGYSLNAIRGSEYYTIHVTPQENGSYVSFETNHCFDSDLDGTVSRVLDLFKPRSCDLLFFQSPGTDLAARCDYRLRKEVVERLECGFEVVFRHYFRPQEGLQKAEELFL